MASLTAALIHQRTPEEATFLPAFAPAIDIGSKFAKKEKKTSKRPRFSELLQDKVATLESRLQDTRQEMKALMVTPRRDLSREEKVKEKNALQEGQMTHDEVLSAMQKDLQLYAEWTITTEEMASKLYAYKKSLVDTHFPIYRQGFRQCGKINELLRLLLRKEVAETKGKELFQEDLPGILILSDLLRSECKSLFRAKMIASIALHAILQPLKYDVNAFNNKNGSAQDKVTRNQTLALRTFFEVFIKCFNENATKRTDLFNKLLQDLNFALVGSNAVFSKLVTTIFFLRLVCPAIIEVSMKFETSNIELLQTCRHEMRVLASNVQKSANHFSTAETDPNGLSKYFQECTALLKVP